MKRTTIILAMCLMACVSLSAQPNNQRGPQGDSPRGGFLNEIPGITEEQKEKIQALRADQREEMQKTSEQNRASIEGLVAQQFEAQQKQWKEARAKFENELKKILTADQFTAYQEKQTERPQMQSRLPKVVVIFEPEVPEPSLRMMRPGQSRGNREFGMRRPEQGPGNREFNMRRPDDRQMGPTGQPRGEGGRMDRRGPRPEQQKESSAEANS